MHKKPKIAVFIDDGNMWSSFKSIGKLLDYSRLKKFLATKFNGTIEDKKIFFYKACPKQETREYSLEPQQKFITFLKKRLNFKIRSKKLKTILARDKSGNLIYDSKTCKPTTFEKGNFDVEITIDAINFSQEYQIAVFFSGDSDFLPLIHFLQKTGKKVFVFSTKNSISNELRTGTNGYFDIATFPEIHGKNLKHRIEFKKHRKQPDHESRLPRELET
jgi:uncharacterized LabA/DUF88 family protein